MRRRFVPLLVSALVAAVCGGAIIAAVTSLPAAKPPVNENAGSEVSDSVPPGVVFAVPPAHSPRSDTAAPPAGGPATASVDSSPSESSPYKPGAVFAAPPAHSSRSDTAAPPAGGPATASVDPSPSESSPYKPGATFAAPPVGSSAPDNR